MYEFISSALPNGWTEPIIQNIYASLIYSALTALWPITAFIINRLASSQW
jgi:hypothetical protein